MSRSHDDAARACAPTVLSMMREVEEGRAQKKTVADAIIRLLHDLKLAYRERVANSRVGCHPSNRGGAGLEVSDAHGLLERIVTEDGWSWVEVAGRARAFEVAPGDEGEAQYTFNFKLVKSADGYLPEVDELKILAVTCNNTVCALRIVEQGVKGTSTLLCSQGVISREKVLHSCPAFSEPLEQGLEWDIIRHSVEKAVPSLPHFLQSAGNKGHGVERKQTTLQIMLEAHQVWKRHHNAKDVWDTVRNIISREHPNLDGIDEILAYLANFGGGEEPVFLLDLLNFSKSLSVRRDVTATSIGQMANVALASHPEYITAVFKASLCAPEPFVQKDGSSRLFQAADLAAMTKLPLKGTVATAADMMRKARAYIDDIQLAEPDRTMCLSTFEVNLVMHVHGKVGKQRETFRDMSAVGSAFARDVSQRKDKAAKYVAEECPWPLPEATVTASSSSRQMRDFSDGGKLALTQESGFEQGATICRKDDPEEEKVVGKTRGGTVELHDRQGKAVTLKVSAAALVDEWKLVAKTPQPRYMKLDSVPHPLTTDHLLAHNATAHLRLALHQAYSDNAVEDKVMVQTHPTRGLVAAKILKVHELTLVPLTPNIGFVASTAKDLPKGCVVVRGGFTSRESGKQMLPILTSKVVVPDQDSLQDTNRKQAEPFMVPFWLVQTSQDSARANLSVDTVPSTIHTKNGGAPQDINIPVLKNNIQIQKGAHIYVYKTTRTEMATLSTEKQPQKKQRTQ